MLIRKSTHSIIYGTVHQFTGQLLLRERERQAHLLRSIFTTKQLKLSWSIVTTLENRSLSELRGLRDMMHKHNSIVFFYKHGIEVMAQHGVAYIKITILGERSPNPQRYNAPIAPKLFYHAWRWLYRASSEQQNSLICPQRER